MSDSVRLIGVGMLHFARKIMPASLLSAAIIAAFCVICGVQTVAAAEGQGIVAHATVLTPRSTGASLALELSDTAPYTITTLAKPDRIVIDLPKVAFAASSSKAARKAGPVSAFRYGLFIADRSRIVLDLSEPALLERVDVTEAGERKRMIFHFGRVERTKFADAAAKDAASRTVGAPPSPSPLAESRGKGALPVVVLDPGHGGIDGGATATDGTNEKTIVFALAMTVKERLEKSGRVKVVLTRSDDSFVSLGERVRRAREHKADLMVSLHADKLLYEKGVRGASVYTVSEKASDVISARLADSENAADQAAGVETTEEQGVIGDILFDLTKRETRISSIGFARDLVSTLPQITSMHKNPLRAAGFRVLTAPDVPSVLIETGYLSSAEDAKLMKTDEWRKGMADAIASAVEKYLGQNATRVTNSAARP